MSFVTVVHCPQQNPTGWSILFTLEIYHQTVAKGVHFLLDTCLSYLSDVSWSDESGWGCVLCCVLGGLNMASPPSAAPGRGRFGPSVNTKWASPSCALNPCPLMRGRPSPLVSRSRLSSRDRTGWKSGQRFVCRLRRHWLAAPSCLCAGAALICHSVTRPLLRPH